MLRVRLTLSTMRSLWMRSRVSMTIRSLFGRMSRAPSWYGPVSPLPWISSRRKRYGVSFASLHRPSTSISYTEGKPPERGMATLSCGCDREMNRNLRCPYSAAPSVLLCWCPTDLGIVTTAFSVPGTRRPQEGQIA